MPLPQKAQTMDKSQQNAHSSENGANLHRWLGYGGGAALIAGLLMMGSSALTLAGAGQGGLSVSEFLSLAALVNLGVVLVSYWQVAVHTQTIGLRKSAIGLFGMLIVMEGAGLNFTEAESHWWNILIWVVLGVVTFLLLIAVWNLEELETEDEADSSAEAADKPAEGKIAAVGADAGANPGAPEQDEKPAPEKTGKVAGGVLAALAFVALIALKATAKVGGKALMKVMSVELFEILLGGTGMILTGMFLGWFALVKFRLRKELGGIAAWLALVEVIAIVLVGLGFAGMAWDPFRAFQQAPLNEDAFKGIEATWMARFDVGSIVLSSDWAILTASLFWSYRKRLAANSV
jgi:hypothetical protein